MNAKAALQLERTRQEREAAVLKLNRVLATEIVRMFRYRRHCRVAGDLDGSRLAGSDPDFRPVELVAGRIIELGGVPDLHMNTLARRSFIEFPDVPDGGETYPPTLLDDDMIAEAIAADAYREIIDQFGAADPETCRLLTRLIPECNQARPGQPPAGRAAAAPRPEAQAPCSA